MAHIHEKIDFTVTVFIVYQHKVLLRLHEKYHIWLPVGGHIELDEDPNEAAVREAKEESGLNIVLWSGNKLFTVDDPHRRELIPPVAINRHDISPTHEHLGLVYFARANSDLIQPAEGEADAECRWLAKNELDLLPLAPDIKFYAALALETLAK